ncbi:MAG: Holliday junction resolvase RuvX [Patescibacteria group bacterium]|jgi:putative Holliday junction resolvase|nr:Holliday junction resolvase RuvX [Patescibacteria group bacterium]
MAILGIDYGAKKIGLAKSDQLKSFALPLKVLANTGREKVLLELKKICQENEIEAIVVGVPVSFQNGDKKTFWRQKDLQNQQMKEVLAFITWLKDNIDLPVEVEDERLSTKLANGLRRDLVKKGPDDAVAAMLILQTYLDQLPK